MLENQKSWLIAHHPLEVVWLAGACNPMSLVDVILMENSVGYINLSLSIWLWSQHLYSGPGSSVVRAPGIYPVGPGFNPQSGHFLLWACTSPLGPSPLWAVSPLGCLVRSHDLRHCGAIKGQHTIKSNHTIRCWLVLNSNTRCLPLFTSAICSWPPGVACSILMRCVSTNFQMPSSNSCKRSTTKNLWKSCPSPASFSEKSFCCVC